MAQGSFDPVPKSTRTGESFVEAVWRALIDDWPERRRPRTFDPKSKTTIRAALRVYPPSTVVQAVQAVARDSFWRGDDPPSSSAKRGGHTPDAKTALRFALRSDNVEAFASRIGATPETQNDGEDYSGAFTEF